MHFVSCLGLLLCVWAVDANVCCFPRQYQAIQGLMKGTVTNGRFSVLYGNLFMYYDGINKRETFIEDLTVDGVPNRVTVIKDYNATNTKYVISNGHCTHKSLEPFKEGCIPDWAQKMMASYYGMNDMSINIYNNSAGSVASFLITSGMSNPAGTGSGVPECFPILDVSTQPTGASPYMQTVMFHNFTIGIQNPKVFDIPAVCNPSSPIGK